MTESAQPQPRSAAAPRSSAAQSDASAGRRPSRLAERSALRNPLPALAAAITVFLVVLALMVARLSAGHDPGLGALASTSSTTLHVGHGRTVLRTTASGRTIVTREGEAGQAAHAQAPGGGPLVTRTSPAAAGRNDE